MKMEARFSCMWASQSTSLFPSRVAERQMFQEGGANSMASARFELSSKPGVMVWLSSMISTPY